MNNSICILGGTGFVGRFLVNELSKSGYNVKVLTRRRERHRELMVLPTVSVVNADVKDEKELIKHFKGVDIVINLIGILNEKKRGKDFRLIHVELARRVVEACRKNNIKRLLHMSALNASLHGGSQYLQSKGEAEQVVHTAVGIQTTSFRPSVIFGPQDDFFNRFARLLKATPVLFPLACPNAKFAPIYVGDVVKAFMTAIQNHATVNHKYELCGPEVFTLKELVEYTAELTGIKRRIIGLSSPFSRLQAQFLGMIPGKPFSMDNYLSLQVDSVCKEKIPQELGVNPVSIKAVVPVYLARNSIRERFYRFRSQARRELPDLHPVD